METVAVVGLGRFGLPLDLSLAGTVLRAMGSSRRLAVLDQLAAVHMPFSGAGTRNSWIGCWKSIASSARSPFRMRRGGTGRELVLELESVQMRRRPENAEGLALGITGTEEWLREHQLAARGR